MSNWSWAPYVPVAQRREKAQKATQEAIKSGKNYEPVVIEGRTIAKTFWGKAWCDNLEAYSDYENRLPRGRSYARNGSVIDLKIEPGKIIAQVMGSHLYKVEIAINALSASRWNALVKECTGSVASLIELLQGKFSKSVMERLCAKNTGLFPSPNEIRLACSCPDWASLCKHLAAVLYGVGARLDEKPELLFVLRQVDANDLLSAQVAEIPQTKKAATKAKVLDESALADVFGFEIESTMPATAEPAKKPRAKSLSATKNKQEAAATKVTTKKPANPKGVAKATTALPKKAAVKKSTTRKTTSATPITKPVTKKRSASRKPVFTPTS